MKQITSCKITLLFLGFLLLTPSIAQEADSNQTLLHKKKWYLNSGPDFGLHFGRSSGIDLNFAATILYDDPPPLHYTSILKLYGGLDIGTTFEKIVYGPKIGIELFAVPGFIPFAFRTSFSWLKTNDTTHKYITPMIGIGVAYMRLLVGYNIHIDGPSDDISNIRIELGGYIPLFGAPRGTDAYW
jgi:hypothetical protein